MVVAIGSETSVAAPLSANHDQALAAIDRLDAWGTTPLYDATLAALDAIQCGERAAGAGAAVRRHRSLQRTSRPRIWSIRCGVATCSCTRSRSARARPSVFAELAAATGGRSFFAKEPRDLAPTLTAIARELRFQYLLGYVPSRRPDDSGWHAIEVTVERPDARVRARDGYFSR